MKKILILGAGLVAKPMVDYLLQIDTFKVILASRTIAKADKLIKNRSNGEAVALLADDDQKLAEIISNADIVVSLLPYNYHIKIAKICLKHKISMVTTSYVSEEMRNIQDEAERKNILILNEIGLDPGIDHMSAKRIIDNVKSREGKIIRFRSFCGGLPAPGDTDNPWKYKFSWSPKGVLKAGTNPARYRKNGEVIEISGENLFKFCWPINFEGLGLETYPNRDSNPYASLYGIEDAMGIFRGTLRYRSWCRTMLAVSQLGLLSEVPIKDLSRFTNREIICKILRVNADIDLKKHIARVIGIETKDEIIQKLEWLDMFKDESLNYSSSSLSPLDFLNTLMLKKMQYSENERDIVVLRHDFIAEFKDKREYITSTLIEYGQPNGDSAMSRTVSLPAAIAVKLILEGKVKEKGVKIPVDPEIYLPVLAELEKLGIRCKEKTVDMASIILGI